MVEGPGRTEGVPGAPEGSTAVTATRVDAVTGVTEHVGLWGPPGVRRFVATALPGVPGLPLGVVVCPSIWADADANARREVVLARTLAARGIATQRFQYRGTGNSDGDAADTTFAAMCDDARAAADLLVARADVPALAVVGTRFGALVAASVARELGAVALVLWEPVLDARRHHRDAFRVARMADVRKGATDPARPAVDGLAELEAGRPTQAVGHRIEPALFRSSDGVTLAGLLAEPVCPSLVVQFGEGPELRPGFADVVAAAGDDAEGVVVACPETWWFTATVEPDEAPVVGPTVAWLAARASGTRR